MALVLTGLVDCGECGISYEGAWSDESSDTIQDMDEAPEQEQSCPECRHSQLETWPGYVSYTEAGLHITRWDYIGKEKGSTAVRQEPAAGKNARGVRGMPGAGRQPLSEGHTHGQARPGRRVPHHLRMRVL